jgi:aldehyde:ferredoxin oxidoreductase
MQPILKIDLSTKISSQYTIPIEWLGDYIGGASLAARILYSEISPGCLPLSPKASLLFLSGPLTGSAGPAVGRSVVCGRSPATGLWGESNVGGFWGTELRMAGYFGLWLSGTAEHPIYIIINDDKVEIRNASHLWGKETYDTQDAIMAEVGLIRPRLAVIGPAGENLLPFASIMSDHGRVAGRTGMGAIMGSKLLKAIVVKGSGKVPIANPEIYLPLRAESNRQMRDDPMSLVARATGTAGVVDYFDYLRSMPKKYYQLGSFNGVDKVSGSTMAETILRGVSACHACVIACGRVVSLDSNDVSGKIRKGPEYETVVGFGPNLLNNDLGKIVLLGELCDRMGMDTISASNILGLAFLMYEKGLLTEAQTDGHPMEWGDTGMIESLLRKMVFREGIGALLATGARTFATLYGHPELAVEVNNLEVPYHDPRGVSGMALVYATSPRGACHNQSDYFFVDIGQFESSIGLEVFDRQGGAEKAANVAIHQNWRTVTNSLVMCLFANLPPNTILGMLQSSDEAFSGVDLASVLKCGERGWNLKRVINNRLGLRSINDSLPAVFQKPYEDFPEGADGYVPDFPAMITEYYRVRGWDPKTGFPLPEKLHELGLEWASGDLWIGVNTPGLGG